VRSTSPLLLIRLIINRLFANIAAEANANPNVNANGRNPPASSLLATYILGSVLGINPGGSGRFGDYVVNEEGAYGVHSPSSHSDVLCAALQNLLNELMANGGGGPTEPPTPDIIIQSLPRVVLRDDRALFCTLYGALSYLSTFQIQSSTKHAQSATNPSILHSRLHQTLTRNYHLLHPTLKLQNRLHHRLKHHPNN